MGNPSEGVRKMPRAASGETTCRVGQCDVPYRPKRRAVSGDAPCCVFLYSFYEETMQHKASKSTKSADKQKFFNFQLSSFNFSSYLCSSI